MLKNDLIEQVRAIPGNPEVCLFDWQRNIKEDSGDGSGCGVYSEFDVSLQGKDEIPEGTEPWIAVGFKNSFIETEDEEIISEGLRLVTKERLRHIEVKGYDKEHDEGESAFQLSAAAAMFIANAHNKHFERHTHNEHGRNTSRFQIRDFETGKWGEQWPWGDHDGRKKSDVITSLVKAGSLVVAEIDRLKNE
jgi:hypothetical protein